MVFLSLAAAAVVAGGAVAICAPPPPANPPAASGPVPAGIAPLEIALTFAWRRTPDGAGTPLLVLAYTGRVARALDLTGIAAAAGSTDAFAILAHAGRDRLLALAADAAVPRLDIALGDLLPAAAAAHQIAAGANFVEHGAEVSAPRVFQFPKFGAPDRPAAALALRPGVLLDFEGEVCLRFDRDVASLADFDAAAKGFFLCGDFTDRALLTRTIGPGEIDGRTGFPDAKSGPGFFPSGPFLVVPHGDWRAFLAALRFGTDVDGVPRQDARAGEMIRDFRALAASALADGGRAEWRFAGRQVTLLEGTAIRRGSALMSGTPAGVLYRPPDAREIACGAAAHVCLGRFLGGSSLRDSVIERFLDRLAAAGVMLRPGREVRHASDRLGEILVRIE